MSKYLLIPHGDYKISVQDTGKIVLDTGFSGEVEVTGNLKVLGTTTTIESVDLSVDDNIIILNDGETANTVSLNQSGLRIDRGERLGSGGLDAYVIWDEQVNWYGPTTAEGEGPVTIESGGFWFKKGDATTVGIKTNSITTDGGGNLYLINTGTGVISVEGTNNYESNVTDPDHIPNKKYTDDAISTAFATVLLKQIGDGTNDPTTVITKDSETTGLLSNVEFNIDSVNVAKMYQDRFELYDLSIESTKIETTSSNEDLILMASGTGSVRINDTLHINYTPDIDPQDSLLDPVFPNDGAKVYIKDQAEGGTGVFFANAEQTRDELISNNRSLIYSMIF